MDPKKKTLKLSHQIELVDQLPKVLIETSDGFIGSYLAQKLLELPLELIFLSDRELEEIKHLEGNERFTPKTFSDLEELSKEAFPKLEYVFQILDARDLVSANCRKPQLTEILLNIAKSNSAKFQLAITANSEAEIKTAINSFISQSQTQQASQSTQSQKEALDSLEQKLRSFTQKHQLNARLVWIINAYGPKMPLKKDWVLAKLLTSLHNNKQLIIEGEGLTPTYPVFVADVVSALAKAMFSEGLKGKVLLVASEKEITAINLAYKLREMVLHETGELIEILFTKRQTEVKPLSERMLIKGYLVSSQADLNWKPILDLEAGLAKTLDWLKHQPKALPLTPLQEPELEVEKELEELKIREKIKVQKLKKPKTPLRLKKLAATSLLALTLVLLTPPLLFFATAGSASLSLRRAATDLLQANTDPAITRAQNSTTLFRAARQELALLAKVIPEKYKGIVFSSEKYLETGQLLAQSLEHSARALNQGLQAKEIIFSDSRLEIDKTLTKLNGELESLYVKLSYIELLLASTDKSRLGSLFLNYDLNQISQDISNLRLTVSEARKILDLLPALLAAPGRHTYLVLLQNNAELRPTGGFIGSYALISFENGKLFDFTVEDVYTADGQLKGYVKPPSEIEKYLGEAGWYLRDSNWDPDFPTAARQIEWFFEKETGRKVDGTIALNLYTVQEILRALGPLELPDYQVAISADNLFETAEYYSEIDFFPGSTQKRDFLVSLSKNLVFKSQQAKAPDLVKLATALHASLKKGQLLLALHHPQAQEIFNDLGWDGSIRKVSCPSQDHPCSKTYLAIREANLGVNKANYFIKRKISLTQDIKRDITQTELTINYQNLSPINRWPGGDYKNYLRVYLEEGSQVNKVLVDNKELASSELSLKAEHGKQLAGFLVVVPVQQERRVTLILNSEATKFYAGKAQLSWLIQKQSGTENDPLTLTLIFPAEVSLTSTNLPMKLLRDSQATLSQNFTQDLELQVEFEKGE